MSSAKSSWRERREAALLALEPSPAELLRRWWAGLASAEELLADIQAHGLKVPASEASLAQLRQALEVQEDNLDV